MADKLPPELSAVAPPYFYVGTGNRVMLRELVAKIPALLELLGDDTMLEFVGGALVIRGNRGA